MEAYSVCKTGDNFLFIHFFFLIFRQGEQAQHQCEVHANERCSHTATLLLLPITWNLWRKEWHQNCRLRFIREGERREGEGREGREGEEGLYKHHQSRWITTPWNNPLHFEYSIIILQCASILEFYLFIHCFGGGGGLGKEDYCESGRTIKKLETLAGKLILDRKILRWN